jgi:glycerophosphoryl diester phosphodiesterase
MKTILLKSMAICAIVWSLASCQDQQFPDRNIEVKKVDVKTLPDALKTVRDYVVPDAVIAHRGSTFWTPEETEAAYRWAREIGADYLELDLQCSKDGVILALHDDNLKRTTDIENVYGEFLPSTRKAYYMARGLSEDDAAAKVKQDEGEFLPYYASSYMYEELMRLDAGTWFNIKPEVGDPEQARSAFSEQHQYISTLEDVIMIAQGKRLLRRTTDSTVTGYDSVMFKKGERRYTVGNIDVSKTIDRTWLNGATSYEAAYTFEYEDEPTGMWNGNSPGVYPEFKESWLNPSDMEARVKAELSRLGWNIMDVPATDGNEWYKNDKVNIGNTNGRVILQTFALSSLVRVAHEFEGKVPMCFLLWPNSGSMASGTPSEYASSINLAIANKAHIIGPCIAGAPNNYPEANADWQAYLIHKAGMLNHPYSFDTRDQMNKYYGIWDKNIKTDYNKYLDDGETTRRYIDGMFSNHADETLKFYLEQGKTKFKGTESASAVLDRLGYTK